MICVVLIVGVGCNFIVGVDICEFGKLLVLLLLFDVCEWIEFGMKLVVVVLYGVMFGGGFEVVLVVYYWFVVFGVKFGLFEVMFGLLFGVGGM